jgi:hypothetical protein
MEPEAMSAATREALLYAAKCESTADRARYLEIENSALRAQLRALQEKATSEKVFAVHAENAGLRKALESLRADMDLAKDLGAKADAVREECAKAAEARGYESSRRNCGEAQADVRRRLRAVRRMA